MRIEEAGARTWLLGAVALWAVCTWALAAFGLGGRVEPLPEDPALLQPLPQAGSPIDDGLGPLPQYSAIRDRALFEEDRTYRPFVLEGAADGDVQGSGFDVVLTSVLITPRLEMAIVQPREGEGEALSFRLGESSPLAPDWTLTSLSPRSAVFNGPDGELRLELRVFDGIGGEPPTPMDGGEPPEEASAEATTPEREPVRRGAPATGVIAETGAGNEASDRNEQAEAIRRRIEARRARLREQQPSSSPTPQQQNP
ncbi:hypothetical protein [Luteimonas sp. A478]